MRQFLKNKLKEQKGLTLIELLAVIVILGIIAAIAIPSILSLIDNTKKDAHLANAQQIVSAARNLVASNEAAITWNGDKTSGTVTLATLESQGLLDSIEDPDGGLYDTAGTIVTITRAPATNKFTYTLVLENDANEVILSGNPSSLTRANITR